MAESIFSLRSENATVRVDEGKIKPINSKLFKGIIVPLSIHFKKITDRHNHNLELAGRWLSVTGKIELALTGDVIFYFHKQVNREIFAGHAINTEIHFEFTQEKIDAIESIRTKDLELNFNASINLEIFNDINGIVVDALSDVEKGNLSNSRLISRFEDHVTELRLKIAKSHWVEDILSVIYKPFRLVQVPSLKGRYSKSILSELRKAEDYYVSGDFDKTVSHCRSALEGIKKKFPGLREKVRVHDMKEWRNDITGVTLKWLDDLLKVQSDITNQAHHADPISFDIFSRRDAESIYLVTVAVILLGNSIE